MYGQATLGLASSRSPLLPPRYKSPTLTAPRKPKALARASLLRFESQRKGLFETLQPKLTALIAAALPFMIALPADAHEYQKYFQLASPGLAVVVGSLAYAMASPPNLRRQLLSMAGPVNVSTESVSATKKSRLQTSATRAAHQKPVTKAQPQPENLSRTVATSYKDVTKTDEEPQILYLEDGMEAQQGRGRMILLAFAGEFGRGGATQQNSQLPSLQDNPLIKEKGIRFDAPVKTEANPVEKVKGVVSQVIEWTGLDAREVKPAAAKLESKQLQGNVVPLHKSNDSKSRELVPVTAASEGPEATEQQTAAVIVPTAPKQNAEASNSRPIAELQAEHQARVRGLQSAISSNDASPVASKTGSTVAPQELQQKQYDAKLSALKESAVQKKMLEEERWQQRASLASKMSKATEERLQAGAVEPYGALMLKTSRPKGMAMLHPKIIMQSIVETLKSVWRIVVGAAKRVFGQGHSEPQTQA